MYHDYDYVFLYILTTKFSEWRLKNKGTVLFVIRAPASFVFLPPRWSLKSTASCLYSAPCFFCIFCVLHDSIICARVVSCSSQYLVRHYCRGRSAVQRIHLQLVPHPPAVAKTRALPRLSFLAAPRRPLTTSSTQGFMVLWPRGTSPPTNMMPLEHVTAAWPVMRSPCHIPPCRVARLLKAAVCGKWTKDCSSVSKHAIPAV